MSDLLTSSDLIFTSSYNIKDGQIFRPWSLCLDENKAKWQGKAAEGKIRILK